MNTSRLWRLNPLAYTPEFLIRLIAEAHGYKVNRQLGPAPGMKGRDRNKRCECGRNVPAHKNKNCGKHLYV